MRCSETSFWALANDWLSDFASAASSSLPTLFSTRLCRVGVRRLVVETHFARRPEAQQLVAPCARLEFQFLVQCDPRFEIRLALLEKIHLQLPRDRFRA